MSFTEREKALTVSGQLVLGNLLRSLDFQPPLEMLEYKDQDLRGQ